MNIKNEKELLDYIISRFNSFKNIKWDGHSKKFVIKINYCDIKVLIDEEILGCFRYINSAKVIINNKSLDLVDYYLRYAVNNFRDNFVNELNIKYHKEKNLECFKLCKLLNIKTSLNKTTEKLCGAIYSAIKKNMRVSSKNNNIFFVEINEKTIMVNCENYKVVVKHKNQCATLSYFEENLTYKESLRPPYYKTDHYKSLIERTYSNWFNALEKQKKKQKLKEFFDGIVV